MSSSSTRSTRSRRDARGDSQQPQQPSQSSIPPMSPDLFQSGTLQVEGPSRSPRTQRIHRSDEPIESVCRSFNFVLTLLINHS